MKLWDAEAVELIEWMRFRCGSCGCTYGVRWVLVSRDQWQGELDWLERKDCSLLPPYQEDVIAGECAQCDRPVKVQVLSMYRHLKDKNIVGIVYAALRQWDFNNKRWTELAEQAKYPHALLPQKGSF